MTAIELAREWTAHATRFGILAEIHNGVYSEAQLQALAREVLALAEQNAAMGRVVAAVGAWRNGEYRDFCNWLISCPEPTANPAMRDERAIVLAFDAFDVAEDVALSAEHDATLSPPATEQEK